VSLAANLALAAAGAAALGGALAVGWLAPGQPPDASVALARHAQPAADTAPPGRPGEDMAASAARLTADLPGERPPAEPTMVVVRQPVRPPPGPAVTAAAPEHDAGLVFRSQTAAVVRLKDHTLAVLLAGGPDGRSRLLRVGDAFDERWRLTALTMDEAVLGDGVTHERVPLFGNPAAGAGYGAVQ
jgi:hypothetical protein